MAKVSYNNLKLKTNTSVETIDYEGNTIEVLQYLPINDKYDLVMMALQNSIEGELYNPVKLDMYLHLYLVYMYSNLSFTDKQREDESKLYDTLKSNGLIDMILDKIPEDEYEDIYYYINIYMEDSLEYKKSVSGLADKIVGDITKSFEALQQKIGEFNPEDFSNVMNFVKAANADRPLK